jgi:hypothetical protein
MTTGSRSIFSPVTIGVVLVALHGLAAPRPLPGQETERPFKVSPALIGGVSDPVLGIRGEVNLSTSRTVYSTTPYDLELALNADLPFTLDPDENPETHEVQVSFMGFWVQDWGYTRVGLEAAGEAAQRVDNADVSIGLTFEYDHDRMGWWYAIPALELAYDFVGCVGCDPPDDLLDDQDDDFYHRVDLRADWSASAGVIVPALDRVRFRPALRWFTARGMGTGLDELRTEDGLWGRLQLGYFPPSEWLYEVYVSYRGGDLPVRLETEEAWGLGLSIVF